MRLVPRALARRYAAALQDVALARDGEKGELALRGEIEGFAALLAGHRELASALSHPALAASAKTRLLGAVARRLQASERLQRLLELLLARDRIALLPAIAEAYAERVNARRGIVSAEVVSAVPLGAAQRTALVKALRRVSGLEVDIVTREDPELLGGVRVRMAGRTYDGTVRGRLAALRRHLSAAP